MQTHYVMNVFFLLEYDDTENKLNTTFPYIFENRR